MAMEIIHTLLIYIKTVISLTGILVIFVGVLISLGQFGQFLLTKSYARPSNEINLIRLRLGRILILGLEFIVAADLIGTITTPDYYDVGILAIIVIIRSILSYTINKEIESLSSEELATKTP
jgi:uncharacterized membrane protein